MEQRLIELSERSSELQRINERLSEELQREKFYTKQLRKHLAAHSNGSTSAEGKSETEPQRAVGRSGSGGSSGGGEGDTTSAGIEELRAENKQLRKQMELSTAQLHSLQRVVELQETDIRSAHNNAVEAKVCVQPTQRLPKSDALTSFGFVGGVQPLMLWRQKVFELMVQLKSAELTAAHEKTQHTAEMHRLNQQLITANRAVRIGLVL